MACAGLYRMLALAFSYPEPGHVEKVRRDIGAALVTPGARLLSPRLAGPLRHAALAWRSTSLDELRDEHSRLFLGSGPVALREGGYSDGMRFAGQPVDLADVNGFYLAFGFGPPATAASPPDHLGTELEFMSLLHLKVAYAMQRKQREQVHITRAAMGHFVEDHLGRWVGAFRLSLQDAGAGPAYLCLARLMTCAVDIDARRLGVTPLRAKYGAAADPVGLDTLTCPLAEQAQGNVDATPHTGEPA